MRPTEAAALSRHLIGREFTYSMCPGDSLASVGARFGVDPPVLAKQNGLSTRATISAGRVLRIDNRHVVPAVLEDGILINVPQRLLFYFESGNLVAWYPVGMGRADWPTPRGRFFIATKEKDPVWDVPRSIQEEMRREGKRVETRVAAGPRNPLGEYWMGLTPSSCGIHGTTAPTSVYRFQTHGCIRLHPDDVADLFPRVSIGTPVEIVYRPVLAARLDDGSVWIESHPDVYRTGEDPLRMLEALESGADDRALAREVIRKREGIATRIPSRDTGGSSGEAVTPTPAFPQTAEGAAATRTRRLP
ncbi:MAG: L,D-transpeptidase family protein [Acidobacteriota bacterium]|nr:L,D-transpeptidase family protein [Acidobacteriota bacterium]